jgi:hypothetical protein
MLYNPLFGVKGTERSLNAEDLRETLHNTPTTQLANWPIVQDSRVREKGPIRKPRLSTYHKLPLLILIFTFVI